jgi:hypothetical protein
MSKAQGAQVANNTAFIESLQESQDQAEIQREEIQRQWMLKSISDSVSQGMPGSNNGSVPSQSTAATAESPQGIETEDSFMSSSTASTSSSISPSETALFNALVETANAVISQNINSLEDLIEKQNKEQIVGTAEKNKVERGQKELDKKLEHVKHEDRIAKDLGISSKVIGYIMAAVFLALSFIDPAFLILAIMTLVITATPTAKYAIKGLCYVLEKMYPETPHEVIKLYAEATFIAICAVCTCGADAPAASGQVATQEAASQAAEDSDEEVQVAVDEEVEIAQNNAANQANDNANQANESQPKSRSAFRKVMGSKCSVVATQAIDKTNFLVNVTDDVTPKKDKALRRDLKYAMEVAQILLTLGTSVATIADNSAIQISDALSKVKATLLPALSSAAYALDAASGVNNISLGAISIESGINREEIAKVKKDLTFVIAQLNLNTQQIKNDNTTQTNMEKLYSQIVDGFSSWGDGIKAIGELNS